MVKNSARIARKQAPAVVEEPEDDWEPLHPLHRMLVDEYAAGPARVRRQPRFGARLAVIALLALASWAAVLAIVKLLTNLF